MEMTSKFCEFCNTRIHSSLVQKHFTKDEMCVKLADKLASQKYPIYCKDVDTYYKILDKSNALIVYNTENDTSITILGFKTGITHYVLDNYYKGIYEDSTEQEFAYAKIQAQNDQIRKLGKFKPSTSKT